MVSASEIKLLEERVANYKLQIEQVYASNDQHIDESKLLGELLRLISNLPVDIHLFCDPNFGPISIFCLTLFSFNNKDTIAWLQNRFNLILSECSNCILRFTQGKCKMLQHFAIQRKVSHEHVSKFNEIVCAWRAQALLLTLRSISVENDTNPVLSKEANLAVFECICNPQLLRSCKELKAIFDVIFGKMIISKHPLLDTSSNKGLDRFTAGVIYCWFEGTLEQVEWAKIFLINLHRECYKVTLDNFGPELLEEIFIHFLYLQNRNVYHERIVSHFWARMVPIFDLFEPSVIKEYFVVPRNIESLQQTIKHPIDSIYKLWYNHLCHVYNDKPLDILLRALKMFLEKIGNEFWTAIEPFTFHSILDIVFERDSFLTKLTRIQNNPILQDGLETLFSPAGSLTDLVSWTLPFYHSLSPSKRIQMVKKVSMAFLRIISNNHSLKSIPKACLMNSSTALLRAVLNIKDDERATLYENDNFETILYTKADSRILLNNELILQMVVVSATNPNSLYPGLGVSASSISTSAMIVLANCIDYDILILCQATYKLYSGRKSNEIKVSNTLLTLVVKVLDLRRLDDGPNLAVQLLASLRNVNGLLTLKSKDPSILQHNQFIQSYTELVKELVSKLTDILPGQLVKVLSDKAASQGFWSCVFSPDKELYQAATNILYETFDVEGRLEGIQELLTNNLTNNLEAINMVLSQLVKNEFYEPCPRAIRVLMDVINAFTDPISGMFSNYSTLKSEESDLALRKFWRFTWKFFDMIYRATLKWATKYAYTELENFTKDTLDCSHLLLDSYREFSDILVNDCENGTRSTDLFQDVLDTFKNMLYWLRLSDEDLLASCVKLTVLAADLAKEKQLMFDDELVDMMTRYATKAKKYSNKLSQQQSNEILARAKSFNEKLTESIVAEADLYHREKERVKLEGRSSTSASPSLPSLQPVTASQNIKKESRADYLQRKAAASSITGRPKSQAQITSFGTLRPGSLAKPQPSQPKQPSKLELARRQLLTERKIHPPSGNVFNPRPQKPKIHRHGDSSSDESDDDIDDAKALFALSKPKERSGPVMLDINGKEIKNTSKIDQKKLDEEYMRRRLNVDLNPFYSKVLKWDYTKRSEYPTNSSNIRYEDVKDEFNSPDEYQKIMEPLLLLECWQGLCAARDREDYKPFSIVVGNRTTVSDFYEVYASISKKVIQESGVSEADLIVLAFFPEANNGNNRLSSDDFKNAAHTCLAKVRHIKGSKGDNMDLTLRIDRSHGFARFLTLRSQIHAVKVMQMTTVEREYSSLEGLPFYDLVNQILKAKPTLEAPLNEAEVQDVKANYKLNTSQAKAVVGTVSKEGFSLIQGPPGTGKTKTILGIVGYFLSIKKSLPSNVIRQPNDSTSASTEQLLLRQKVLICAPSNAAVDELVLRLRTGIIDNKGSLFQPKLVRVGRSDAVNAAIKDLTLEELVEKRVADKNYEISNDPNLEKDFHAAINERRKLRERINAEDGSPTSKLSTDQIGKIQLSIRELSKKINELGKQRDEIRERNSVNYRNRELDRRKAQARILAESEVICSTLSGSAHDVLASLGVKFDTVIVDEACQCTELSSIIPLRYGGKRCIMVGDPNQLPPTVLSGAASNFKYNQSLFVRMEKNCVPHLLDVQYRMHPAISRFPSLEFYKGKLKDGPDMDVLNKRPWHSLPPLGSYKFFDIVTGRQEQNKRTMSFVNAEECRVAIELVDCLFRNFERKTDFTGKIGVISPYREQMQKMKREFRNYFGNGIFKSVDFNTIDGFQGQEKEIIIISCVRADDTKTGVGFLKDFRRMNVALTRAKTSMWILGHHKSLYQNELWRHLIDDAKDRGCLELACSGFLDPKNTRAEAVLKRHVQTQDNTDSVDGYDPTAEFQKSRKMGKKSYRNDREKRNRENEKTSVKKKQKLENPTPHVTGTKKKSSIFGGPSLAVEITASKPHIKELNNEPLSRSIDKNKTKKDPRNVRFSDEITFFDQNSMNTTFSQNQDTEGSKGSAEFEDSKKSAGYKTEASEFVDQTKLKLGNCSKIREEASTEVSVPGISQTLPSGFHTQTREEKTQDLNTDTNLSNEIINDVSSTTKKGNVKSAGKQTENSQQGNKLHMKTAVPQKPIRSPPPSSKVAYSDSDDGDDYDPSVTPTSVSSGIAMDTRDKGTRRAFESHVQVPSQQIYNSKATSGQLRNYRQANSSMQSDHDKRAPPYQSHNAQPQNNHGYSTKLYQEPFNSDNNYHQQQNHQYQQPHHNNLYQVPPPPNATRTGGYIPRPKDGSSRESRKARQKSNNPFIPKKKQHPHRR